MNRILVIRGGAIGDFVLTLPGIKLLRDTFPPAQIEILGYKHIVALADRRFYANQTRSIEYASTAAFFARDAQLYSELVDYFASFDLILSYLFDPDAIFETNLKRCRIAKFIAGPSKPVAGEHAAYQLARPLEELGLRLENPAAQIFPLAADRDFARSFLDNFQHELIALHPGSGSHAKNWPIENWKEIGERLLALGRNLLVVSGEADEQRVGILESAWRRKPVRFAKHLRLPQVAALLENSTFLGHDSGISHIAAAVGARCTLLFGPTDPAVWAPANKTVSILSGPRGKLDLLDISSVIEQVGAW